MKKIVIIFILNIFLINKSFALIEIDITRGNSGSFANSSFPSSC